MFYLKISYFLFSYLILNLFDIFNINKIKKGSNRIDLLIKVSY